MPITSEHNLNKTDKQVRISKTVRVAIILLFSLLPALCKAQSMVTEVSWRVYSTTYTGLLVLFPNNQGILKICSYDPNIGTTWIEQDATLTNQYDMFGNCTSYINCRNPRTTSNIVYYADYFVVFPNGRMYTQDAAGTWSTQIVAQVVPTYNWQNKFQQYNINIRR